MSRFQIDRRRQLVWSLLGAVACVIASGQACDADSLREAFTEGKPLVDLRLRFEDVDQRNKTRDAVAITLRARLGYQTADFKGFSALAEFDFIQHLGPKQFNDSINGLSAYPTIADPDMAALNRLQLGYATKLLNLGGGTEGPDFKLAVGRQRIVFGDGRYIGNADWRQHEQTFDALAMSETPIHSLTLSYAYVARVNRVFGPDGPMGHFDSNSHLFNAVYSGLFPSLKLEAFAYLLDLRQAPTLSTATYGVRLEDLTDLGSGVTMRANAAFARQKAYANNPLRVDLADYLAEAGLGYRGLSGLIGYEVLQGNGTIGFQTPLANLHPFQGWAETFLTKPPNGLNDFYLKGTYALASIPYLARVSATVAYHKFSAEHITADYGNEWDGQLEAQLDSHLTFDAAYADYAGAGPFPDKKVFWLYGTYRY